MNNIHDETYNVVAQIILDNGTIKKNRTGQDTIGIFGHMAKYDLLHGFPLITTKKMAWKSIVTELLWFIKGDTNIKYLVDNGCNIWNDDAYRNYSNRYTPPMTKESFIDYIKNNEESPYSDLGMGTYGGMWRGFPTMDAGNSPITIDQLSKAINTLKTKPDDRRILVSAWHPYWVDHCALPPCHVMFQLNTEVINNPSGSTHRRLNLALFQRSCDYFLGVPFNIASYALLLKLIAHCVDMEAGTLTHFYGDLHIYTNHINQITEQLTREPFMSPLVSLNMEKKNLFEFKHEDIELVNYECHPAIRGDVSTADVTQKI